MLLGVLHRGCIWRTAWAISRAFTIQCQNTWQRVWFMYLALSCDITLGMPGTCPLLTTRGLHSALLLPRIVATTIHTTRRLSIALGMHSTLCRLQWRAGKAS